MCTAAISRIFSAGRKLAPFMASATIEDSESQEDEVELLIQKRWVVRSKGKRNKWWVASTKDSAEGDPFIRLSKFDRSFVYFCLGKGMDLGAKVSANVKPFDDLLAKRKAASVQAVLSALEGSSDGNTKKRKVREEDRHLCKDYVNIELEEVKVNDCKILGGHSARVLWGLDSSTLWLELTKTNMEYMKELIRGSQDEGGKTRKTEKLEKSDKMVQEKTPSATKSKAKPKTKHVASPKLKRKKAFWSPAKARVDQAETAVEAGEAPAEAGHAAEAPAEAGHAAETAVEAGHATEAPAAAGEAMQETLFVPSQEEPPVVWPDAQSPPRDIESIVGS